MNFLEIFLPFSVILFLSLGFSFTLASLFLILHLKLFHHLIFHLLQHNPTFILPFRSIQYSSPYLLRNRFKIRLIFHLIQLKILLFWSPWLDFLVVQVRDWSTQRICYCSFKLAIPFTFFKLWAFFQFHYTIFLYFHLSTSKAPLLPNLEQSIPIGFFCEDT